MANKQFFNIFENGKKLKLECVFETEESLKEREAELNKNEEEKEKEN